MAEILAERTANEERLLRQQAALANFGSFAFREADLLTILSEAAHICAETLKVGFCKVCRYRPQEDDLLIVAGCGWDANVIGRVVSKANETSPQGRAYVTGEAVIIRNLQEATNLEVPDFYAQHGIVSTIDVVIKSIERPPYGVLEVDSPVERTYDTIDINFLTGFANVLAEAVATQTLLAENRLLTRELHHRVRNNLQLIQGLLDRCSARVSDDRAKLEIESIALRVMTLAQVQDQLLGTGMSWTIDFGDYLKSLCAVLPNLQTVQTGNVHLTCDVESVVLDLDTVTSLGMVVAELVTNSYSHAFPDGREGSISVSLSLSRPQKTATLRVEDNGIGFDSAPESKRYGLGLVRQLVEKVHGTVDVRSDDGTTWTLTVPTL